MCGELRKQLSSTQQGLVLLDRPALGACMRAILVIAFVACIGASAFASLRDGKSNLQAGYNRLSAAEALALK